MRELIVGQVWKAVGGAILLVLPLLFASVDSHAQELRAGYAKVDITPTGPVFIGGYDLRGEPSDGIHGNDRLYARALVFEASGVRVAFVVADVIEIQGHDIFRRKIAEATGIPEANILLGDVHNHSAPSPNAEPKTEWDRQFARWGGKSRATSRGQLAACPHRRRHGAFAYCHEPAPSAPCRFGLNLDLR